MQVLKEEVRERILAAAVQVFYENLHALPLNSSCC